METANFNKDSLLEPLFSSPCYLTDGGLETSLIFQQGIDLPFFSALTLLERGSGEHELKSYYQPYLDIALRYQLGFILESPTWRGSSKWGRLLGLSQEKLKSLNQQAIQLLRQIKNQYQDRRTAILISGCIGPQGDGYKLEETLSVAEAMDYHIEQMSWLRDAGAEVISAFTLTHVEEAIGIVLAAKSLTIPVVIGFTLETNGHLPSGQRLQDAIFEVDKQSANYAEHFMINCAHPSHFLSQLFDSGRWKERVCAVRANASTKSHAELDQADELDEGCPNKLGVEYAELKTYLPKLKVIGGCCGTDARHIESICRGLIKIAF